MADDDAQQDTTPAEVDPSAWLHQQHRRVREEGATATEAKLRAKGYDVG